MNLGIRLALCAVLVCVQCVQSSSTEQEFCQADGSNSETCSAHEGEYELPDDAKMSDNDDDDEYGQDKDEESPTLSIEAPFMDEVVGRAEDGWCCFTATLRFNTKLPVGMAAIAHVDMQGIELDYLLDGVGEEHASQVFLTVLDSGMHIVKVTLLDVRSRERLPNVKEAEVRFFVAGPVSKHALVWNGEAIETEGEVYAYVVWPPHKSQVVLNSEDDGLLVDIARHPLTDDSQRQVAVLLNGAFAALVQLDNGARAASVFLSTVREGTATIETMLIEDDGKLIARHHQVDVDVKIREHALKPLPHPPLPHNHVHEQSSTLRDSGTTNSDDDDEEQEKIMYPDVTMSVITFAAPATLQHSLEVWRAYGLIANVNETIILVQSAQLEDYAKIAANFERVHVIPSAYNIGIGRGMAASVIAARTEYVLFMEDDWVFHPDRLEWKPTFTASLNLLKSGTAQFIRFRDNDLWNGTPMTINCTLQNFLPSPRECFNWCSCFWGQNAHTWGESVFQMWIELGVRRCHHDPEFLCFPVKFCPWTNNPLLYSRKVFGEEIGPVALSDPHAWRHWLENEMNYRKDGYSFCARNLTIAAPTTGMFVHFPLYDETSHGNLRA